MDKMVRAVVTEDRALVGTFTTADNVDLVSQDMVLVTGTPDATDNGIYLVEDSTWTRLDLGFFPGYEVRVQEGNDYAYSKWILDSGNVEDIVLGTTNIVWFCESKGPARVASSGIAISNDGEVSVEASGVTPGFYILPSITVLADGRVTSVISNAMGTAYIEGLVPQWATTTTVTITPGAAYIPGANKVVRLNSAVTINRVVPSPVYDDMLYLYLYESNGVGQVEISQTRPVRVPYLGSATTKTGDTSRRYIGAISVHGAGSVINGFYADELSGGTLLVNYTQTVNSSDIQVFYHADVPRGATEYEVSLSNNDTIPSQLLVRTMELVSTQCRIAWVTAVKELTNGPVFRWGWVANSTEDLPYAMGDGETELRAGPVALGPDQEINYNFITGTNVLSDFRIYVQSYIDRR